MLFNSLFFLFVFFPIVTGFYYFIPHKFRWVWLLVASCYFYMSFIPSYLLILALTISIDYVAGRCIERLDGKKKRAFLLLSICSNLGVLFVFKYFDFFNANLDALAQLLHWNYSREALSLILPIGLSFHTFQGLAYIIEVYRGRQKAERSFGIFALYVLFYPQLVAGPIERPQRLLHQFRERHYFRVGNFFSGMRLIVWGLFKKVVIADRISVFVNEIFNNVTDYSGPHFVLATILFAFQIYCDFSGYSDMARGLARTLGFELMVNFRAPYFSKSVAEFWQRWHISLSTWFRDYVYIPLGGSRVPLTRWQTNIMITFALSGLWHGANWTFVIWGCLNGLYVLMSRWSGIFVNRFTKLSVIFHTTIGAGIQILVTFLLICVSWIFFRAQSVQDALYMLDQIFRNGTNLSRLQPFMYEHSSSLIIALFSILFLLIADTCITTEKLRRFIIRLPVAIHAIGFSGLVFIIALLGRFTNNEFIYFQF